MDHHRFEQRAGRAAGDPVVERAAAIFDLGEIIGGDRDLDRAGHRERLVAANADQFASLQVERGDAIASGPGLDERGELLLEGLHRRRRGRQRGLREEREEPEKCRNEPHASPASLVKINGSIALISKSFLNVAIRDEMRILRGEPLFHLRRLRGSGPIDDAWNSAAFPASGWRCH